MNSYIRAHLRDIVILPFSVTVLIPWWITGGNVNTGPWWLVAPGILSILGGVILLISTVRLFYQFGRGTIAPWAETKQLLIMGPYRYTRNPMISGVFFILVGEAAILNSYNILYWCITFFLLNTIFFIAWEEPRMEARFGAAYRNYRRNVRRWIPLWKPFDPRQKE